MSKYIVCQINGKEYRFEPGKVVNVDFSEGDDVKILLSVDQDKVKIGQPYLDEKIKLETVGTTKLNKIRVAKFHAKANYRRVKGSRKQVTQLIWKATNASK